MFGTSGIRGVYGEEVTEDLAMRVAAVFSENSLAIGRDIRESGIPLSHAAIAGAVAEGADVIDLEIVPTPTVAYATKQYSCRGMMITASHNPPEYNGMKLIENAKEIDKKTERDIEAGFGTKLRLQRPVKRPGDIYFDTEIIRHHKEEIIDMVDAQRISKKKPKIIVDCNGAASVITPYLLTDLGCEVISVNSSLRFSRPSEPSEENLSYLLGLIKSANADFAIAHDGDGDRCTIIDDSGAMLPLDVQLAIMIEHILMNSKNKKIISTVEASLTIREAVEDAGGEIEITPVGSTYVGEALERKNAIFGGEPCGEYIYTKGVHVPDAILAAAKFAEIFSIQGSFSKLKKRYKQHFIAREKFKAPQNKDRYTVVEEIMSELESEVSIEGAVRKDDGIRIDEDDGWLLIRASGTEPLVRLTMEYKSEDKLKSRKEMLSRLISEKLSAKQA